MPNSNQPFDGQNSDKEKLEQELEDFDQLLNQARPKSDSIDKTQLMYQAGWNAALASVERRTIKNVAPKTSQPSYWRLTSVASIAAALGFLTLYVNEKLIQLPTNLPPYTQPAVMSESPLDRFKNQYQSFPKKDSQYEPKIQFEGRIPNADRFTSVKYRSEQSSPRSSRKSSPIPPKSRLHRQQELLRSVLSGRT